MTFNSTTILLVAFFVLVASFFWWWQNCGPTLKCKTVENVSNLEISGDIIKKNETIAMLTAQVVKKQIDILLTIGSIYASKKELTQLIQQDKWREAINLMSGIFKELPEGTIEKIVLADVLGTAKDSIPTEPELIGKNFAFRDWYRGVTADFKPYVSEVYQRASEPRFNMVGIAFPVNDIRGIPTAILLLHVKTDIFQKWLSDIKFGTTGLSYIVDQRGHVIVHPDLPTQSEIVDYSSKTEVQKVISGQSGTEISFGAKGQRTLSSYEPIIEINWGVITRIELNEVINSGLIKGKSMGETK